MSYLQRKTTACYGIERYLDKKGIKPTKKTVSIITARFLEFKNLPFTEYNPKYRGLNHAGICNAELVQEHFSDFKKWVETIAGFLV